MIGFLYPAKIEPALFVTLCGKNVSKQYENKDHINNLSL